VASAAGRGSTAAAPVGGLGGPSDRLGGRVAGPGGPASAATAGDVALGAKLGDAGANGGTAGRISAEANRTATRDPRQSTSGADPATAGASGSTAVPPAVPGTAPVVTTQTVTETRAIPYQTRLVRDPALPRGQKRVETEGINGEETLRWLVTFRDGKQADRQLVGSTVTRQPQHRVIAFGWQGRVRVPGRGHGGPGHGPARGHHRECGPSLRACLPLGRSACPDPTGVEESGVQVGDPVTLLSEEDLALLDPSELDGLNLDPALTCP
jgi:hypothetical protein